jgi:predicted AlkP superfamily pyrophosphatase or phosphodiesterase
MSSTLPAKPKAFGNLRHVFKSAISAVSGDGKDNPLGFKAASSVTVIFVDGLGRHQILERSGHAPWLSAQNGYGYSMFPSTTVCGISSFATGAWPGEHGLVGHQAFDRELGLGGNLLSGWGAELDPDYWQQLPTLSEKARERGVSVRVIGPGEYEHSGFTRATMRDVEYVVAEDIAERFAVATRLSGQAGWVSYLYIPELDQLAHRSGWQSAEWASLYEMVADEIKRFVMSSKSAAVVTADHGLIDTEPERKVFLRDALSDVGLTYFAGDTRASYLYGEGLETKDIERALTDYRAALTVHSSAEVVSAGWLGPVSAAAAARLPEVVLLARSNYTLFHEDFSKPRSVAMVAHHGGLSAAEIQVPLMRFGV